MDKTIRDRIDIQQGDITRLAVDFYPVFRQRPPCLRKLSAGPAIITPGRAPNARRSRVNGRLDAGHLFFY